jgi:hypothetical protein
MDEYHASQSQPAAVEWLCSQPASLSVFQFQRITTHCLDYFSGLFNVVSEDLPQINVIKLFPLPVFEQLLKRTDLCPFTENDYLALIIRWGCHDIAARENDIPSLISRHIQPCFLTRDCLIGICIGTTFRRGALNEGFEVFANQIMDAIYRRSYSPASIGTVELLRKMLNMDEFKPHGSYGAILMATPVPMDGKKSVWKSGKNLTLEHTITNKRLIYFNGVTYAFYTIPVADNHTKMTLVVESSQPHYNHLSEMSSASILVDTDRKMVLSAERRCTPLTWMGLRTPIERPLVWPMTVRFALVREDLEFFFILAKYAHIQPSS